MKSYPLEKLTGWAIGWALPTARQREAGDQVFAAHMALRTTLIKAVPAAEADKLLADYWQALERERDAQEAALRERRRAAVAA